MKKLLFAIIPLLLMASCGSDDENDAKAGVVSLSVYCHHEGESDHKLAKDGHCWFGLFECEPSAVSADLNDVYNIGDNRVVTLRDGKTLAPRYSMSTDLGTCTLENVAFGKYTAVVAYRNGTRPTSSDYYYYVTKAVTIDNPAANVCRFDIELGIGKYGKLINQ